MTTTLAVTPRDESIKTETLRDEGKVPAIIYGPKQEPTQVVLEGKAFDKVKEVSGESTIIEITGLSEPVEVLIKDIDFSPVKQRIMHVDFYAIERGKEMTVNVPLSYVGEAPVESAREGSVNKILHEVEVTCRPSKLPSEIEIDLSVLKTVEDKILIKDLNIDSDVTISAEPEDPVAVVSVAQEESAEEEDTAEVDMDAIEVEQKGKQEEGEEEKSE